MIKEKQAHGGSLNRLQKGETANPNGRPPSIFKRMKASLELTFDHKVAKTEVDKLLMSVMCLSDSGIEKLLQNEETPAIIKNIVTGIQKERTRGNTSVTNELIDRMMGRAVQQIDNTFSEGQPTTLVKFDKEEARKAIDELIKESE